MVKKSGEIENQELVRQEGRQAQTGAEFGAPKSDKESLEGGAKPSEGQGKEIGETATQDLIQLSKGVGESASPASGEIIKGVPGEGGISEKEIADIIHDGGPVKDPAELLERLMNSGT